MGLGLAFLVVVLVAAAIGFCLWAIHQYLAGIMIPAAASLVTGVIALAVAGVLGWIVQRLGR